MHVFDLSKRERKQIVRRCLHRLIIRWRRVQRLIIPSPEQLAKEWDDFDSSISESTKQWLDAFWDKAVIREFGFLHTGAT